MNQKDIVGSLKAPLSVIPVPVLMELGLALQEGALKYGAYNWRTTKIVSSAYYNAALRHLFAWHEGEDTDQDSGLSHITKAIAGLTVLRDAMIQNQVTDDRPPKSVPFMEKMNIGAKALMSRYGKQPPNPVEI